MKNLLYILTVIIFILLAVVIYQKIHASHEHHEESNEQPMVEGEKQGDAPLGEEEHDHGEMVHLNLAQYQQSGIDTGWFEMKNLSEVIHASGFTKLPPQNQAQVSSIVKGNVKSIQVIEGQYVKAGQTLATIQSLDYNNIRLEREKLKESLSISTAQLEYLKLEYQRQKSLNDELANAKKTLQRVESDLQIEEKKIASLQSQINILDQNILMASNSDSPIIPIKAPISGHITDVDIHIGSPVDASLAMFTIVDNAKMHVDLLVYEKDLFKVKTGQTVRFVLTNQNNKEIPGKIFSIGKSFENETKSVAVHADIDNHKQMLISGMYVNAMIDLGRNTSAALPEEAIIKDGGREFIFIYEKENIGKDPAKDEISFAKMEVKAGTAQLGFRQVEVLDHIHDGDKIVVKGAYYLQSHLIKSTGGGGHDHHH